MSTLLLVRRIPFSRGVVLSPGMRLMAQATVVLVALALSFFHAPAINLIASGCFAMLVYGYLAWVESQGPILLTPLSFHFAWYAVAFGIAAVHFGLKMLAGESIDFLIRTVSYENVEKGYILSLLGSLIIHLAMRAMKPHAVSIQPSQNRLAPFLFLVGLVTIASTSIIPGTAILPFFGSVAGIIQYLPYAVLMLLALRPSRHFWLKMMLGTGLLLAAAFLNSSKFLAMLALFPLGIYLWRRSKQTCIAFGIALSALYILVIAPVIMASREVDKTLSAPKKFSIAVGSYNPDFGAQWNGLMERLFEPVPAGFLVSVVEDTGFQNGATMGNLVYGLVPRAIWPNKPTVTTGARFTTYVGAARSEDEATTSTGMTAVGELYWNFGLPGVIVGMALIAAIYGGLWRLSAKMGLGTVKGMLAYIIATVSMVNTPDASTMILNGFLVYLFMFGVLALTSSSPRKDI